MEEQRTIGLSIINHCHKYTVIPDSKELDSVTMVTSPVHPEALGSLADDLMDEITAGNRDNVTVNTRNTLSA